MMRGMGDPVPVDVSAEALALFADRGAATYAERVTMEQHARQAAALARAAGAEDALVLAALLHDCLLYTSDAADE